MSKVVHCKKDSYDYYIGRSITIQRHYGNPFVIGEDGSREEVIEKYRLWLLGEKYPEVDQLRRMFILDTLHKLKGKTLGCWCSPDACHGDVLAEMANE